MIDAGGYTFSIAGDEDDADVLALLRDNALGGWIQLSLEREPSAFAARALFDRHEFVIVRERSTRRPIGLCEYSVRRMYVNRAIARVPYLGALRVDNRFRHRVGVLRHGFAAVRALLHDSTDYPAPLTAITADSEVAMRILSAGLEGLPRYAPIGELTTVAATARRAPFARAITPATTRDLPEIAALLRRVYEQRNFAPVWEAQDLERLADFGLPVDHFLIARHHDQIVGCVGVWDQRGFKQSVVRGYARWVHRARPLYNLAGRLFGAPQLPASGTQLNQVFLSHLAVAEDDEELFRSLVLGGLSLAKSLRAEIALIGTASPAELDQLRRFTRSREYRTRLHLVQWAGSAPTAVPSGRIQPEIALL